ncbi:RNA polymerase sigma-70 factor [Actinomadura sp. ATCC 31491]|uniref:RNA polymerase sigma-70 factor n=1 Tax=Actinomadura luzonensis TaxID=2805427 RepID=A0ABT0G259_9ACTN|nr:RNA polymerase sigma-70 factor [Actinomadura luzonensis]MCK2218665.1 RNA polymerase sigma-70 factor [Actinomadura luzonensis]
MTVAGDPDDLDAAARVFAEVRPRLFGIAYRMLGSAAEAEDLVQDVWLRWQAYDRATVEHPPAFLATTITRLAINAAQSARARRETYPGPWLPEPVDTGADPYLGAERGEALGFAVLLLLERLSPTERAAYVLREAFEYSYREIAAIVQLNEPAVRQLVSRARKRLLGERRKPVTGAEQRRLLTAFVAAARAGDLRALEELFAADVTSYSDGGGAVRASRFPVVGRERVAKYVRAFAGHFWAGVEVAWASVNGQPAALLSRDGEVFTVLTVEASREGIEQVLWMMNPAKLTAVPAGGPGNGSAPRA